MIMGTTLLNSLDKIATTLPNSITLQSFYTGKEQKKIDKTII